MDYRDGHIRKFSTRISGYYARVTPFLYGSEEYVCNNVRGELDLRTAGDIVGNHDCPGNDRDMEYRGLCCFQVLRTHDGVASTKIDSLVDELAYAPARSYGLIVYLHPVLFTVDIEHF